MKHAKPKKSPVGRRQIGDKPLRTNLNVRIDRSTFDGLQVMLEQIQQETGCRVPISELIRKILGVAVQEATKSHKLG